MIFNPQLVVDHCSYAVLERLAAVAETALDFGACAAAPAAAAMGTAQVFSPWAAGTVPVVVPVVAPGVAGTVPAVAPGNAGTDAGDRAELLLRWLAVAAPVQGAPFAQTTFFVELLWRRFARPRKDLSYHLQVRLQGLLGVRTFCCLGYYLSTI